MIAGSTNCVVCSHHHESGSTAAAETREVAISQVPVFDAATVFGCNFGKDILLSSFEFGFLRMVSCLENGASSSPDRMLNNVTMATSLKLRPPK